jgi:hypothetical protein
VDDRETGMVEDAAEVPVVEPLLGVEPDEEATPAPEPLTGIEPDVEALAERKETWGPPAAAGDPPAGA